MRILVLADIHANWAALQAIQEEYDACLFVGDLVDYGVEPSPCIDWVRNHATVSIRGNHDHAAAQHIKVNGGTGYRYLTGVTRPLTIERLSTEERRFLSGLPVTRHVTLDHTHFFLVHATPRDPLDEYVGADPDFWAKRLEHLDADVVCVGHTHQPYVLEVGKKLVVNPGSVGQPRDGDPRASYAVIEDHRVELKRVEYDVEAAVRTIEESELPDDAKEMLAGVLRNGGIGKPNNGQADSGATPAH